MLAGIACNAVTTAGSGAVSPSVHGTVSRTRRSPSDRASEICDGASSPAPTENDGDTGGAGAAAGARAGGAGAAPAADTRTIGSGWNVARLPAQSTAVSCTG